RLPYQALFAVEHLDFFVEVGCFALRTEAAAVDRDALDHGKDLAPRYEVERRSGTPGHPRQQPLFAETELDFEGCFLDRDERLDATCKNVQGADPARRSCREDHVAGADSYAQRGTDQRVQPRHRERAKGAGEFGEAPAGIVRRDARGEDG